MSLFSLGGINDFGARFYDKTVGRWWGVDALAEKWNTVSPYIYTLNNPILFYDKDGKDVYIWYNTTDKSGNSVQKYPM